MRLLPSAGPTTPESVTPCDAVAVLRTDLDARAFQDRAQLEADLEVITKLADGRFRADAERVTVALPNLDWEGDPLIQTLEGHCGGLVG